MRPPPNATTFPPSLQLPGLFLGVAVGGLFDGVVFHQLLGWHHMVCLTADCQPHTYEQFQRQTFTDGLFHATVCLIGLTGLIMLVRRLSVAVMPDAPKRVLGLVLAGWGIFNLLEGTVVHHIYQLHHVRPGDPNQLTWDVAFLAFGLILTALGWMLAGTHRGRTEMLPELHPA